MEKDGMKVHGDWDTHENDRIFIYVNYPFN